MIIVYNDYNSYFSDEEVIGAVTQTFRNFAFRNAYKLIEVYYV